jgi:hypothetical protein
MAYQSLQRRMDSKSTASSLSSPSSTAASIQTLLDSSAKIKEAKQQEQEQLLQSSKHAVQQSTPDSELQRRARLQELHDARQAQQQRQQQPNHVSAISPIKNAAIVGGGIGVAPSLQAQGTLSPRFAERSNLLKTSSRWACGSELCCGWTAAQQLLIRLEI